MQNRVSNGAMCCLLVINNYCTKRNAYPRDCSGKCLRTVTAEIMPISDCRGQNGIGHGFQSIDRLKSYHIRTYVYSSQRRIVQTDSQTNSDSLHKSQPTLASSINGRAISQITELNGRSSQYTYHFFSFVNTTALLGLSM